MGAKRGTCTNDQRRAVGTFQGKPLCGPCRPRSTAWKEKQTLKAQRKEQEAQRKAAKEQKRTDDLKAKREQSGVAALESLAEEIEG